MSKKQIIRIKDYCSTGRFMLDYRYWFNFNQVSNFVFLLRKYKILIIVIYCKEYYRLLCSLYQ